MNIMDLSQNDLDEILAERHQLETDLNDCFRVIIGLLQVFGIDIDKTDQVSIAQVAKAMKNLAFDAMIPGSSKRMEEKFSFLMKSKHLVDRHLQRAIEIQDEYKSNK